MKIWIWIAVFLIAITLSVAVSCGDDDDDNDSADENSTEDDDDTTDDDDETDDDDDDNENLFNEAEQNVGQWVWIDVPQTICRDQETSGFGVRLQEDTDKLVFFIQGGGNCTDADSCEADPPHGSENDFDLWVAGEHSVINGSGDAGIFNTTHDSNPVKDWNFVLIPYCTGDYHAGSREDGTVDGVDGTEQFLGYQNMGYFTDIIAPYFKDKVSQVLLAGDSAGALGSLFNYSQVADAFGSVPVYLFNDSGPLHRKDVMMPCWQDYMYTLWGMNPAIPDDCSDCYVEGDGDMALLMPYLAENYPNGLFAMFSDDGDLVGRMTIGKSQDDCTGTGEYPHDDYRQGLLDLRDELLVPTGKWATFIRPGDMHTMVLFDETYFLFEADGIKVTDWLSDFLNGTIAQVGP